METAGVRAEPSEVVSLEVYPSHRTQVTRSRYYAVARGLRPGVYNSWKECAPQVVDFKDHVQSSVTESIPTHSCHAIIPQQTDMQPCAKATSTETFKQHQHCPQPHSTGITHSEQYTKASLRENRQRGLCDVRFGFVRRRQN